MRSIHFPLLSVCTGAVGVLFVAYIGLIAVVMTYASLTIEFTQSVKTDEAKVAVLEAEYLARVVTITNTNYAAEGYAPPTAQIFVPTKSVTALR